MWMVDVLRGGISFIMDAVCHISVPFTQSSDKQKVNLLKLLPESLPFKVLTNQYIRFTQRSGIFQKRFDHIESPLLRGFENHFHACENVPLIGKQNI